MNVNEIASLGSNVKSVIQNENCAVLMLNDATGEGVMTVYRVMPGVMICFSDMYMEQCASEFYLFSFVAYLYELENRALSRPERTTIIHLDKNKVPDLLSETLL